MYSSGNMYRGEWQDGQRHGIDGRTHHSGDDHGEHCGHGMLTTGGEWRGNQCKSGRLCSDGMELFSASSGGAHKEPNRLPCRKELETAPASFRPDLALKRSPTKAVIEKMLKIEYRLEGLKHQARLEAESGYDEWDPMSPMGLEVTTINTSGFPFPRASFSAVPTPRAFENGGLSRELRAGPFH